MPNSFSPNVCCGCDIRQYNLFPDIYEPQNITCNVIARTRITTTDENDVVSREYTEDSWTTDKMTTGVFRWEEPLIENEDGSTVLVEHTESHSLSFHLDVSDCYYFGEEDENEDPIIESSHLKVEFTRYSPGGENDHQHDDTGSLYWGGQVAYFSGSSNPDKIIKMLDTEEGVLREVFDLLPDAPTSQIYFDHQVASNSVDGIDDWFDNMQHNGVRITEFKLAIADLVDPSAVFDLLGNRLNEEDDWQSGINQSYNWHDDWVRVQQNAFVTKKAIMPSKDVDFLVLRDTGYDFSFALIKEEDVLSEDDIFDEDNKIVVDHFLLVESEKMLPAGDEGIDTADLRIDYEDLPNTLFDMRYSLGWDTENNLPEPDVGKTGLKVSVPDGNVDAEGDAYYLLAKDPVESVFDFSESYIDNYEDIQIALYDDSITVIPYRQASDRFTKTASPHADPAEGLSSDVNRLTYVFPNLSVVILNGYQNSKFDSDALHTQFHISLSKENIYEDFFNHYFVSGDVFYFLPSLGELIDYPWQIAGDPESTEDNPFVDRFPPYGHSEFALPDEATLGTQARVVYHMEDNTQSTDDPELYFAKIHYPVERSIGDEFETVKKVRAAVSGKRLIVVKTPTESVESESSDRLPHDETLTHTKRPGLCPDPVSYVDFFSDETPPQLEVKLEMGEFVGDATDDYVSTKGLFSNHHPNFDNVQSISGAGGVLQSMGPNVPHQPGLLFFKVELEGEFYRDTYRVSKNSNPNIEFNVVKDTVVTELAYGEVTPYYYVGKKSASQDQMDGNTLSFSNDGRDPRKIKNDGTVPSTGISSAHSYKIYWIVETSFIRDDDGDPAIKLVARISYPTDLVFNYDAGEIGDEEDLSVLTDGSEFSQLSGGDVFEGIALSTLWRKDGEQANAHFPDLRITRYPMDQVHGNNPPDAEGIYEYVEDENHTSFPGLAGHTFVEAVGNARTKFTHMYSNGFYLFNTQVSIRQTWIKKLENLDGYAKEFDEIEFSFEEFTDSKAKLENAGADIFEGFGDAVLLSEHSDNDGGKTRLGLKVTSELPESDYDPYIYAIEGTVGCNPTFRHNPIKDWKIKLRVKPEIP